MPFRRTLRRTFSNHSSLYNYGCLLKLIFLKYSHSTSEALRYVTSCPQITGTILDIGANRGQSAIQLANLKPECEVISFEPNPRCVVGLKLTQQLLPANKFRYYKVGLSDCADQLIYYEPCVNSLPVSAEGSFCLDNLDDQL